MRYSSYELKYCERCGGLGLRRSNSVLPYCCECEQILSALLPGPRAGHPGKEHLRRIVHHSQPGALVTSGETRSVQEAAHVS